MLRGFVREFREFAIKGNVVDLAVGIIIGAAFGSLVNSLVNDLILPPIGYVLGDVDFSALFILLRPGPEIPPPYTTLEQAREAGAVVIAVGQFINVVINFIIQAFAVFLIVKGINRLRRQNEQKEEAAQAAEPTTEEKLTTAINRLNQYLETKNV